MVKFFFTGLLFWGIFLSPTAQNNQRITNFGIIKEKVDSNRFKMQYTIATTHHTFYLQPTTPYSDQNIRIAQDSAFVIIRDKHAEKEDARVFSINSASSEKTILINSA